MSQPHLVVVCDVGPRRGIGHVMRCLALAEEFAARGHRVSFVADVASVDFARRQVEARGFSHHPAVPAEQLVAVVGRLEPSVVVVDSYHLPPEVYAGLRSVAPTVAMVDGDPEGRSGDVVVDQNIGAEQDRWEYGDSGRVLAGLDYALTRDEIRSRRPPSPVRAEADPLRVLAFFGGTDAFGAAPRVADLLARTGRPFDLTVVSPHGSLSPVVAPGQRVEVIGPTDRLADEVRAADLVISAAGSSSWELLCLGAAVGLVCVADNQTLGYHRAVEAGLVAAAGTLDDLDDGVLDRLLGDAALRHRLREAGFRAVDGDGRVRVADAVLAAG